MHPSFLSSSHKLVEHAIGGFSLVSGFFSGVGCLCLGLITLTSDPCNAVVFLSVCVCVCVCDWCVCVWVCVCVWCVCVGERWWVCVCGWLCMCCVGCVVVFVMGVCVCVEVVGVFVCVRVYVRMCVQREVSYPQD